MCNKTVGAANSAAERRDVMEAIVDKPEHIYKYHSAPRVAQILQDLTFYFAPVSQLNDLYEFRVRSLYTETPESKYRAFAKQLVHEHVFDSVDEAVEKIKEWDLETEAAEAYAFFIQQLNATLASLLRHSGVTCFSQHRNNQRMWGTYGDNHAGAVIEFSTAESKSQFAPHLMPVMYFEKRFELCPSEFLTDALTLDQWLCGAMCCIKHWHWRDESEWRLLLLADSEQPTEARIIPFERSAITRVFLGPRITATDEECIRRVAAGHTPEIPVFKRVVDEVEAKEEHVGIERIHSFEQLMYWANRCTRPSKGC